MKNEKCSICGERLAYDAELGVVHDNEEKTLHILPDVGNECPHSSDECLECRHYEPRFICVDSTGRKCAAIYYGKTQTLGSVGMLYGVSTQAIQQTHALAFRKFQRRISSSNRANLLKDADSIADTKAIYPKWRRFFGANPQGRKPYPSLVERHFGDRQEDLSLELDTLEPTGDDGFATPDQIEW